MSNNASPVAAPAATIECRRLSIAFGDHVVLDDFSMKVQPGRVHALLGRNGAGKSTCFRIILGLEDRGGGEVRIFGAPRSRESLKGIGASINDPAIYPHLSARDNARVHTKLLGLPDEEADRALSVVGLWQTGKKKARDFSTGMKARLAIAIALLGSPRILILDEPQNGLDPQGIVDLRRFLRAWSAEGGTVLVSSHQLGEVARLTDDITVLVDGCDAYSGPLADFAGPDQLEARFLQMTRSGRES